MNMDRVTTTCELVSVYTGDRKQADSTGTIAGGTAAYPFVNFDDGTSGHVPTRALRIVQPGPEIPERRSSFYTSVRCA
jgi:hypothetical protein